MDEPVRPGIIRDEKGRFPKGVSGNPAGKPPGTISIMSKIKQIWAENPEQFEKWVKDAMEDKMLRRELIQQVDGKPVQPIANADGQPFVMQIVNYGNNNDTPPVQS